MANEKTKVNYRGEIEKELTTKVTVELDQNDIYNWLQRCENPETLRWLAACAVRKAKRIEVQNDGTDDVLR